MVRCGTCKRELKMRRKDSATSAAVASARSRGRAHRHHREELRRDGGAGAVARV